MDSVRNKREQLFKGRCEGCVSCWKGVGEGFRGFVFCLFLAQIRSRARAGLGWGCSSCRCPRIVHKIREFCLVGRSLHRPKDWVV